MFAVALLVSIFVVGCADNSASPVDASQTGQPALNQAVVIVANVASTRLEGRLVATSASPKASGTAKWELRGSRVKFSTEVEDVNTSGKHDVRVNGTTIDYVNVINGFGDLNLDSTLGHNVPSFKSGDRVEVFNPSGKVILSGTLRAK